MMEVLTGKKKLSGNNIEYPLPWVEPKDAKVCKGDSFVDGCNTLPGRQGAAVVHRHRT